MGRKRSAAAGTPSLHSLLNEASRRMTSELRRVVGAVGMPLPRFCTVHAKRAKENKLLDARSSRLARQILGPRAYCFS